jgi:hypothetical protein
MAAGEVMNKKNPVSLGALHKAAAPYSARAGITIFFCQSRNSFVEKGIVACIERFSVKLEQLSEIDARVFCTQTMARSSGECQH